MSRAALRRVSALAIAASLAGCAGSVQSPASNVARYQVDVRRTSLGIPHIKAQDWGSLGYGHGHAQAEDSLCTLADGFVTFRGERSRFFGPDATPPADSTLGQPKNLESDFFFRAVATDELVQRYRDQQPRELQDLIRGFAAGYNRYLRELKAGAQPQAHRACRGQAWVAAITEADVYRRLHAINLAGGLVRFAGEIANAQPPAAATQSHGPSQDETHALIERVAATHFQAGGREGIGSNAIGFGSAATGQRHGLLLGNPHWYWRGPDRFYQAQLTIPGVIDVAGASLLGTPVILIGFNHDVAWSHTVSTARRFGVFELKLAPGKPTAYLHDGKVAPMTPVRLAVDARRPDGSVERIERTLYRSHHGPIVDLTGYSPAMAWNGARAFAIRDINSDNFRIFRGHLRWAQARSLDEFMRIQLEEASVPWANTVAAGRRDGRAWYADIGAVPNVTDALASRCTPAPFGAAFAKAAPGVPFLDGSRSDCEWGTDADSAQPGSLGRSAMPRLLRGDYVANMNDSHWLANPAQVLAGYPRIIGAEGAAPSLRTRLGHRLVQERLADAARPGQAAATPESVRELALNSRVQSAELLKRELLAGSCGARAVMIMQDPATGERFDPPREVDVRPACEVLRRWNDTGSVDARGAHLWDEFWRRASLLPADKLYAVPFDPADPLNTPRGLNAGDPRLAEALALATLRVQQGGFALDASRGETLFAHRGDSRIPLYGGCGGPGYFTVMCSEQRIEQGGYSFDHNPHGNSYLQLVAFGDHGPQAHTLLAHSQSDDPASPHHGDYLRRYANAQWLRVPFTEDEISKDPALTVRRLRE